MIQLTACNAFAVHFGRTCDAATVEVMGDTCGAVAGQPLSEHPLDIWPGLHEVVAVGWPAAQVAALLDDLGSHGRFCAESGTLDFAFGMDTKQRQQRPVKWVAGIHWAVEFWQPKLHAVSCKLQVARSPAAIFANIQCRRTLRQLCPSHR